MIGVSTPSQARASATAPGKVILAGEHFVVAGQPAIAVAVDVRARVVARKICENAVIVRSSSYGSAAFSEKPDSTHPLYPIYVAARSVADRAGYGGGLLLNIDSDIPVASGMGSSAAVAVATVAAVAKLLGLNLSLEEISSIAYEAEKIVHGKPSGIDNTTSTFGGVIRFQRGRKFKPISTNLEPIRLVLADSGIERSTGVMVAKVLHLKEKYPLVFDPIYTAAGELVNAIENALMKEDYVSVGELMNINHGLLHSVGVSNAKLDELVHTARRAGALGAKITGAGGGGMIVALCWKEEVQKVAQALRKVASKVIVAPIATKGVKIE